MKYQEQHEAFKELMISKGISKLDQLDEALAFGCNVPSHLMERWLNRMLALPEGFAPQRRYVNRFKLGADPEFVFAGGGERVNPGNFKLQQGLAFGMDNNGRLTEIRPHPSRSALNVTASILTTLRWLAALKPQTLQYDWLAGAFLFGDGIGGHVHFGRKRPDRNVEVKALDCIEEELLAIRAYPVAEVQRRRLGDEHRQIYGMPGDVRKQMHGYEYRTFPSWLDSPELAFLTITLSKLVVQNPRLAQGYVPLGSLDRHFQRVKNLLSYYKDTDDDARLALRIVARKFPQHIGGDFKKRWGIEEPLFGVVPNIQFIPSSIKPHSTDVVELFARFMDGTPLASRIPIPTWEPLCPPDGYTMTIQNANTQGAKGLGELLWDVCNHKHFNYTFVSSRDMGKLYYFLIPQKLAAVLPEGWQKLCGYRVAVGHDAYIYSQEKSREAATFGECRRILLETVLPFWQISKVKADSVQQWQATLRKKEASKFTGKILFGDPSALPVKGMR